MSGRRAASGSAQRAAAVGGQLASFEGTHTMVVEADASAIMYKTAVRGPARVQPVLCSTPPYS